MTNLVCLNDLPDIIQVLLGKHKPDVAPNVGNDLLQAGVLIEVASNSFPDGGVLAHEDHCPPTQRDTNLLHLFGTYVVHIHKKDFGIFVKKRLEEKREKIMTCGPFRGRSLSQGYIRRKAAMDCFSRVFYQLF